MGAELTLRYSGAEELERDFESNLRKGRAFVPGAAGLPQRAPCLLHIEHPAGGATLDLPAEAVWSSDDAETGGIGLQFVNFDDQTRDTLRAFVATASGQSGTRRRQAAPLESATDSEFPEEPVSQTAPTAHNLIDQAAPTARNLHEKVRGLGASERDALARQGNLPERVALERRYGSSVWEGMLQNPQLTPREVFRIAKSSNLPTHLLNVIVSNAAWLADAGIRSALLQNPRVSGVHLERVLRAAPQAELRAISDQTNLRMQVRTAAKRLIRR